MVFEDIREAASLVIGSLAIGPLMDKFGRKFTMLITMFPLLFGWLIICERKTVAKFFSEQVNGLIFLDASD